MQLTTNPANAWSEAQVYKFGDLEIAILKAKSHDPVRWYTEIHRHNQYIMSLGSNAFTKFGALWQAYWHDCPKEELGYRCQHALHKDGVVECGEERNYWKGDDE